MAVTNRELSDTGVFQLGDALHQEIRKQGYPVPGFFSSYW